MAYENTASRKRPQNFDEFKGQDFVSATLKASLESGRIAHAYLFSGPRGCGKTSAARILAKALNCEKGPGAHPCGVCRSCVEIARGASLDVIEIDGASNTSVDNVRQIKDEVLFPPNGGRYKVYIIDEVHMLSNSAFNALLKTIEEPPPYIVFIFATTELHKVPATIKSRCQQFAFRLFPMELIVELLSRTAAELGMSAEDEALLWIAKESGGSLRDAYTLFDQIVSFADGAITAALIRDKLGLAGLESLSNLFRACASASGPEALDALDGILARGVSPEQFCLDAAEYFRALLLLKNGIQKPSLLGAPLASFDSLVLETFSAERIERGLALLLALYRDLRYSISPRFELELAVARLCRLKDYVSPSELASIVAALRRRIAGEPARPAMAGAGRDPGSQARLPGGADGHGPKAAALGEKKKPELPPKLSAAFDQLAAAAKAAIQADGVVPDGAEEEGPAAQPPAALPRLADAPSPEAAMAPEAVEAPDTNYQARSDDDLAGLRAGILETLGGSSPLLKTGLSASLPWRIEGQKLILPFSSGINENLVRGSLSDIAAEAARITGRALKIELRVESPRRAEAAPQTGAEKKDEAADQEPDPVEIVERVFRGKRVRETLEGNDHEHT